MKNLFIAATFVLCGTLQLYADLSATVTPGFTFQPGDRPTVAQLNALGRPTISISGTIGGTNSGLATNSITGDMLGPTTFDGVTIDKTNGALRVATNAITTLQLYTNIFDTSSALSPTGGVVRVIPDWNFIAISNNALTIRTSIVATAIAAAVNSPAITYSNQTAIPAAGAAQSLAHGMGTTPSWWRVTLVCTNSDLSYAAGDELDMSSFLAYGQFGNSEISAPAFATYIDPAGTPAIVARRVPSSISSISIVIFTYNKSTGTFAEIDTTKWNLRFRVRQ